MIAIQFWKMMNVLSVRNATTLIVLIGFAMLAPTNVEAQTIPKDAIAEHIQRYVEQDRIIGMSIGIVQGEKEWTAHFGQLSEADSKSATDNTLYEIGSITKVFTGLLLAKAVQDQSLQLEQSIGSVATQLLEANPKLAKPISLVQLATHNSGLPRLPSNLRPSDPLNPYAEYSRRALFEYLHEAMPPHAPGSGLRYSNLGFGLLGELLAMNAGVDYETLLKSTLLVPLGMHNTGTVLSSDQTERLAQPHNDGLEPTPPWDINGLAGSDE